MQKFPLAVLVLLILVGAVTSVAALKSSLLQVAFLNVGQGDAVLVTTPSGNCMLIDGGPDQSVLRALGREMSFYDRSIDIALATSQKSSDTSGLPFIFDRFNVGSFVDSGSDPKTTTYRTILNEVVAKNIPHITAKIGDDINLGDGIHFLISSFGAEITGRIVYGATSIAIPADIPSLASTTDDIVFESDGKNIIKK